LNVPVAPVAVSTASEGRLTPTSCSRTLTTAFDAGVTVQPTPAAVGVGAAGAFVAGAAVGAAVGAVGDAVASDAVPPHAASKREELRRARALRRRIVTKECPNGKPK